MAGMVGYCERREDAALLKAAALEAAARLDLPAWQAELLFSLTLFLQRLEGESEADICCVDVTPKGAIQAAETARQRLRKTRLLLLASMDISPMTYLRPNIGASSLLLRPFSEAQAKLIITELLEDIVHERRKCGHSYYTCETKQGKSLIPYDEILYFESRERRIFLCTNSRQLPFYDTLERLAGTLPKQFLRCHKGFVVNTDNIERVVFSENMLHLRGGFQIPVSRSYKAAVREALP